MNQSAAVKAIKSDYTVEWVGIAGGLGWGRPRRHAPRVTTSRGSTCCHYFVFIQKWGSARRWPLLKGVGGGVEGGEAGGAPEINLIWCPEDGWIPPQRHAVYEFREGFLVNRGGEK